MDEEEVYTPEIINDSYEPSTFEEWIEIHGEPDYLYETDGSKEDSLNIKTINVEVEEVVTDFNDVFTNGKGGALALNYGKFVTAFAAVNRCVYCNGTFYTPEGMVSNGSIRLDISKTLMDAGWSRSLDSPTTSILHSLQDMTYVDHLSMDMHVIPFANGDLDISKDEWIFYKNEKKQTPYRLPIKLDPSITTTNMPLFNKWLHDVFDEDDIPTVQEMLGYCLVPVTSAQEAFFLVGDGGVGKSVLGVILEALFGNAHRVMTTQELVSQRFQLSIVENKLVMYDDDLGSGALTETSTLKKLITADQKIPAERKYGDPYEFQPYCKIVACANFMLSALYDDSDGFFRRLHPILVKSKDPKRKVIRDFGKLIVDSEKNQIMIWALQGLKRVMRQGWEIHWSQRSREYLGNVRSNVNHMQDFVDTTLEFDYNAEITSHELKQIYEIWCHRNEIHEHSSKKFYGWLADQGGPLKITRTNSIKRGNKYYHGFKGMRVKQEWADLNQVSI